MPAPPEEKTTAPTEPEGPIQSVDWSDYREHLSTADKEGRRLWIYPRKPRGWFTNARTWLSWVLLAIMFVGPFIRVDGNPLLLLNVVERKFVILGQVFWSQDMMLSAVTLLVFVMGIIVFTAAFGRLWCGWTCPQTVLMEMLFRKIEYFIEGDAHEQRALAKAPWTGAKLLKKLTKHSSFFALSFVVGNTLLAYIIGTEQLFQIVTANPLNHLTGLTFMILFTLLFYGIFARFREQACTFICPYGQASIARLLPTMPRRAIIGKSLADRGALILTRDLEEAWAVANRIAPEHLEISTDEPERWAALIRHAGAIFLGRHPASRWATTAPAPIKCCRPRARRISPRFWACTTSRSAPA